MKYNSFVNPFISCKTDIIITTTYVLYMHVHTLHAAAGYKEVTLKKHGNNGLAILHGNMKYTE